MNTSLAYALSFFVVIVVSVSGSLFTKPKTEWYKCIKPSITPPSIVFPIVWTVLYALIAVSLARTLLSSSNLRTPLLKMFAINLSLNVLWCYTYFSMHNVYLSAFIIAMVLVSAVGLLVTTSMSGDSLSGYLLVPYVLWLGYASLLNVLSIKKETICRGIGF